MTVRELRQFAVLEPAAEQLMQSAVTRLQLSARSYHRVLKLARTIADLTGLEPADGPPAFGNRDAAVHHLLGAGVCTPH